MHGISNTDVAGGPRFRAIARQTARFLADCDLAGFGIRRFDLPLLAAEFHWASVPFTIAGRRVVDALGLYHAQQPRDLASAVRHYCGYEHTGAHEALADVLAAAAVLDALVARHAELPASVSGLAARSDLVDLQGWRAGCVGKGIRSCWPGVDIAIVAWSRWRRRTRAICGGCCGYRCWATRALVESALNGGSSA